MAVFFMPTPCPLSPPRLLRSLVNLKQVIINAAHYLVLGDKETYHFDAEAPFLQMVSPTSRSARGALGSVQSRPRAAVRGCCSSFPTCPGVKDRCPVRLVVHSQDRQGLGRRQGSELGQPQDGSSFPPI